MPQRSSRSFHPGNTCMRNVSGQAGPIQVEPLEPRYRHEADLSQDRVQRRTPVALAQDQAIALVPSRALWVDPEDTGVQNR